MATGVGAGAGRRVPERGIGAVLLCAGLLAAALIALAGGGAERATAASSAGSLIERPAQGRFVRSYPVRVVVRARDRAFTLRARLNGTPVKHEFGRARHGKRRAYLSRSHGLRRGRNVLRVAAKRRNGVWKHQRISFYIGQRRPLAGAGRDLRTVVGAPTKLRGGAMPAAGSAHEQVRFRWRLLRAPRRSDLRAERVAGMSGARRAKPQFTPDVLGRYVFNLVASSGKRRTADQVTLRAVPPAPLVEVDTMVGELPPGEIGPPPGIQVGDAVYKAVPATDAWLQVLVLDRATLAPVWNRTYDCDYPYNCSSSTTLAADLAKLDETRLVIASSHSGFINPAAVVPALNAIGVPNLNLDSLLGAQGGTFSAIGVPGLSPGEAQYKLTAGEEPTTGRMDGYLATDQHYNFAWLPKQRVPFDTAVPVDEGSAVMVNGTTYTDDFGSIPGGFGVRVFDGHTLALLEQAALYTNTPNTNPASTTYVNQMIQLLSGVGADDLVVIDSYRGPSSNGLLGDDVDRGLLRSLAAKVAAVGGTAEVFNRAAVTANARYSLVGWGGAGAGAGAENSSVKTPKPGDSRLRGALVPDDAQTFKPASTSPLADPSETLAELVLTPPSGAWPYDGDPAVGEAISYIGSQVKQLGADPRSAYWLQPFDQAGWVAVGQQVNAVQYPGEGKGFTTAQFTTAQKQLEQEIAWVGNVRGYLANLGSPFSSTAITSWSDLSVITEEVINQLTPPDSAGTLEMGEIFVKLLSLPGPEELSAGREVISVLYEMATKYLAANRDGSNPEQIRGRAVQIASDLEDALQAAQRAFGNLGDIVVSDYEKLQTVGTYGGCNPGAGCPAEWSFTKQDRAEAATATYRAVEASFDQSVITIAFPSYSMPTAANTNAADFACGTGVPHEAAFNPFRNSGPNGQAATMVQPPTSGGSGALFDVFALGDGATRSERDVKLPPGAVVKRMFGAVSPSGNPLTGGLGIYQPDFMAAADPRPLPYQDECGWQ